MTNYFKERKAIHQAKRIKKFLNNLEPLVIHYLLDGVSYQEENFEDILELINEREIDEEVNIELSPYIFLADLKYNLIYNQDDIMAWDKVKKSNNEWGEQKNESK